jgi:cytochrome c556
MQTCRSSSFLTNSRALAALLGLGALSAVALAADDPAKPPEAPPVSKFAAVEPLMFEVQFFLDDLATQFKRATYPEAAQTRVARDANVLIVLFTALGLHDEDSPVKASAPRLTELAEELAASAADQAKAKTAYEALAKAVKEGATGGKPLAWEKRFDLGLLMKQVSPTHARLRASTIREARFATAKKDDLAGRVALLAAVGQAVHADTHEVKDPAKVGDWYKYASEMRDAAGAVGEAIAKNDFAAVQASMQRLHANCEACHKQFRPDLATTTQEAEE